VEVEALCTLTCGPSKIISIHKFPPQIAKNVRNDSHYRKEGSVGRATLKWLLLLSAAVGPQLTDINCDVKIFFAPSAF
jgi:hypothetical protein